MLSKEETQRKRRNNDSSSITESNGAFEKKQRVEQLIGALARPGKKCSSSSSVDSNNSNDSGNLKIESEVNEIFYLHLSLIHI